MKQLYRKWTSLLLILALVASLIPALTTRVSAAEPITIVSPVTGQNVTRSPVNIVVTVSASNMTRLTEMFYRIENLTTGQDTGIVKTKSAQKSGDYEVTFHDVDLTEGKNRITVVVGETNTIVSKPVEINYTPVTNITSLKLDGETFESNRILPTSQAENFLISGTAPGASLITAYINGAASPEYGQIGIDGNFYFLAEDFNTPLSRSMTTFRLKPGDNDITFTTMRGAQSYSTARHLIYDNGKPFAFGVELTEAGTSNKINLNGSVPYSPISKATKLNLSAKLKFDNSVSGQVSGKVFVNEIEVGDINVASLTKNASWSTSGYSVYDYKLPNISLTTDRYQTVDIYMYDKERGEQHNRYTFEYIPQDAALIEEVSRRVGTNDLILNDTTKGSNDIGEIPLSIKVKTRNADDIVVRIGNKVVADALIKETVSTADHKVFSVDLKELSDGLNTVSITPVETTADNNRVEVLTSRRTYTINISSAPFIIMEDLYNGMVIDRSKGVRWAIKGRVFNLGSGGTISIQVNDGAAVAPTTQTSDPEGFINIGYTPTADYLPGKNTIVIRLYQNGVLATESRYEVFQFGNEAPEFSDIALIPANPLAADKFVEKDRPGTYATNEKYVKLQGTFSPGVGRVKLTVKQTDSTGKLTTSSDHYSVSGTHSEVVNVKALTDPNNPSSKVPYYIATANSGSAGTPGTAGGFTTNYVILPTQGTVVLEFQITNADGIAATKSLIIVREPLPYEIVSPMVTRNAKKEDQLSINSNFVDLVIRAEGADSVTFGKDQAKRSATDPDLFTHTVADIKKGSKVYSFTVMRGKASVPGKVTIFNADSPIVGAQYQAKMSNKMSVFGGKVQLTFPQNTLLMRAKPFMSESFLTKDRNILFGIADDYDGRVDKKTHLIPSDSYDSTINSNYSMMLPYSTGIALMDISNSRFHPASERFWIDGGVMNTIGLTNITKDKQQEFLTGRGIDPYGNGSPMTGSYDPTQVFYSRVNASAEVVPTNPGTLTLKYDPGIRNEAWRYLTVFYFDYYADYMGNTGYRWKNIGGVVDNAKKTITVPVSGFGYYQVMYMDQSFDDVIAHPWAQNQLDTLYSKGYMNKKATKATFDPYDPITRGEFISMLVKIFEIDLDYAGSPTFIDVTPNIDRLGISEDLYEYKYIETAARKGIVRGTAMNAFRPNDSITREDAAIMIAKTANLKLNTSDDKVLSTLQKQFTDANLIQGYARSSVEAVVKAKLMSGIENALAVGAKKTFRYSPKDTFSRAEAAAVALNVMTNQGKVPK